MNKNPYLNALYAAAYICLLVSGAFYFNGGGPDEPNIIYPIVALSLFVLSAAVMGYLFILRPAMMYIEGQKKEAVDFFMKTVATFACISLFFVITIYFIRP